MNTLFNQFVSSQLYFNQAIFSIAQVYYGITFKAILVSIVKNMPIKSVGINTQIPHGH